MRQSGASNQDMAQEVPGLYVGGAFSPRPGSWMIGKSWLLAHRAMACQEPKPNLNRGLFVHTPA